MSQVPKIYNIPIREPMFINGIMSQAWVAFFESLGNTANIVQATDPTAIGQKYQDLQAQIAFGVLVGAVGLQTALTMADGGELGAVAVQMMGGAEGLPSVAVQMGGGDNLPLTHTAPMDGFCGLPMVTILEQL